MSDINVADNPFAELLDGLVRGDGNEFLHLLTEHSEPTQLPASTTTVRTHFISSDANGEPATEHLAAAMARAAIDFCIPRSRIEQAMKHLQRTGSATHFSRLEQQARELFVDEDGTGEGGELLLFLLMEQVLGLPQLLAKMPLKTNSNVHVHGSDGVHAKLGPNGILDLYWGESKLYQSSSSAFTSCFESIAPFFDKGGETQRRDLLLVRDHINVQQHDLAAHLVEYFDESGPKSLQVRWNGVCLIGFDYAAYPNMSQLSEDESQRIEKSAASWRTSVRDRIAKNALLAVKLDVFCIPFPDVDAMRKAVRRKLGMS